MSNHSPAFEPVRDPTHRYEIRYDEYEHGESFKVAGWAPTRETAEEIQRKWHAHVACYTVWIVDCATGSYGEDFVHKALRVQRRPVP